MNGPNTGCRVVTIRLHKKDTAEAVVYTKKNQRASAELFAEAGRTTAGQFRAMPLMEPTGASHPL
jgi:hypothetical protein